MELINILIRTSSRPKEFIRCLKSVLDQDYPNVRIIVSIDNDSCDYVPIELETIRVYPNKNLPFFYDEYCNELKSLVNDGYFLWLDDDDILMPKVLNEIPFDHPAIIVKLNRNGQIYPISEDFRRGQIGMPNIILHHSLKDIANVTGTGQGDYVFIKEVISKVPVKYVNKVLVYSFSRGLGKPSQNSKSIVNGSFI
jgi:hypothetical protein